MRFGVGGYGVSHGEVEDFIRENANVGNWVRRYRSGPGGGLSGSKLNKARILCRFFRWLRVVKDLVFSPGELLDRQLRMRQSGSVRDRQWLLNFVLEHSRDNPDFKDFSDRRKYDIFCTVKSFCEYHEVPLTMAKNVYGKKHRKKNRRKQITLSEAKKIFGAMNQRDRTICLIELQSGMEIGAVLNKFNYMWHSQVKPQLDAGCERLKVEFDERKGSGRWYFTYISVDGIQELRKWLQERQKVIEKLVRDGKNLDSTIVGGEPIFITQRGTPLKENHFLRQFNEKMRGKVTTHMFRKLFKTEASIPERAIDRNIVEFFMGHSEGIDAVGGDYDKTPEIHEEIFEKEFAKLEPFINIYSSSVATRRLDPLLKDIEQLSQLPGGREFFSSIIKDAKAKLEMLKLQK